MIKFIKLFTVFFLISLISFGQLSKTHYIPPLTHAAEGNANAVDQWLYISTPSTSDVNVSILPVGGTAQTITVRNDAPYKFQVSTDGYSQLYIQANTTSRVMSDKGYIIDAEKPIYVSVRVNAGGSRGNRDLGEGEIKRPLVDNIPASKKSQNPTQTLRFGVLW